MGRRSFLKGAAAAAVAVPFHSLLARAEALASTGSNMRALRIPGYGPLVTAIDGATGLPLIKLPEGFRYVTFGWAGDALQGGELTPGKHDGMGAFAAANGHVRLVRNHEVDAGRPFSTVAYNRDGGGGTTTLEFDTATGTFVSAMGSLSGTIRNCAGGETPWGSWLTCEETVASTVSKDRVSGASRSTPHGYVFEVPADGMGDPTPIRDMGRFSHEAVAADPVTGYLYETEDPGAGLVDLFGGTASKAGFYRFVPNETGKLSAGGQLFMLKVKGRKNTNLGASYDHGTTFDVEWVPIARPDVQTGEVADDFVFKQGRALGGAAFARLEGCWAGEDRRIYIVSTNGGRGQGQIWVYNPVEENVSLLFQSPSKDVLNRPYHMTVSPRGGLVLCEDGGGVEFLHGLTMEGQIFPFAENNVVLRGERNGLTGDFTGSEWSGPCFSPDGQWLFANIFEPGITVAITGPWQTGRI